MDRRPSHDESAQSPRSTHTNVFDDEFEASTPNDDAGLSVTNGFRPDRTAQGHPSPGPDDFATTDEDQIFAKHSSEVSQHNLLVRSSISKPNTDGSSSGPVVDRSIGTSPVGAPSASAASALMHRASVASTSSFVTNGRSSTPLGGPSHPYAMYPQSTGLGRTSSTMTSPTVRHPQRAYSGHAPIHPYTMYPQNVAENDEPVAPQQTVPVGFPGHGIGYHRQIGPDGEDQGIVGPDGHTEQLPPYSEHPDEPSKALPVRTPIPVLTPIDAPQGSQSIPSLVEPPLPLGPASPGNVSLPLQDRSPTLPSSTQTSPQTTPPATLEAAPQTAGLYAAADSDSSLSPSSEQIQEKKWGKGALKERSKRKVCGRVPLWLVILILILVFIFAIILGTAIGTSFSKNKDLKQQIQNAPPATVTETVTMFDASIIAAPSDLPSLPTGTFSVNINLEGEATAGCLRNDNEHDAWSCQMSGPPLELGIKPNPSKNGGLNQAWLQPAAGPENTTYYGVQPPRIDTRTMDVVRDNDAPSNGPAFHFQARYDKLVILRAGEFAAGQGLAVRNVPRSDPDFRRRVTASEKPWYCWWNETMIEVYLYTSVNDTTSSSPANATPTPTSSWQTLSTSSLVRRRPLLDAAQPTAAAAVQVRQDDGSEAVPDFSRYMKIEERRLPDSPTPVCQQMQMLDNGSIQPAESLGDPIIFELTEVDPSLDDFFKSGTAAPPRKRVLRNRDDPPNACHCQWTSGP